MNNKTATALGITLMFLGTTTLATAYHIPQVLGDNIIADEWLEGNGVLVLCETTGSSDPVNDNAQQFKGEGGLCYASSQSFTEKPSSPGTTGCDANALVPGDLNCTYNENAAATGVATGQEDISSITPTCTTGGCAASNPADENYDWFIRIATNSRSCNGVWGETFYYKEIVAYYGGNIPVSNGTSGHVTFFIQADPVNNTLSAREGSYVGDDSHFGALSGFIDATKTKHCSGDGDFFGIA